MKRTLSTEDLEELGALVAEFQRALHIQQDALLDIPRSKWCGKEPSRWWAEWHKDRRRDRDVAKEDLNHKMRILEENLTRDQVALVLLIAEDCSQE